MSDTAKVSMSLYNAFAGRDGRAYRAQLEDPRTTVEFHWDAEDRFLSFDVTVLAAPATYSHSRIGLKIDRRLTAAHQARVLEKILPIIDTLRFNDL